MKHLAVLMTIVFLLGLTQNNMLQNNRVIWKAGIIESSECKDYGQHGDYQAEMQMCKEFSVVKEVSKLPINVGMNFGIEYEVVPSLGVTCFEETRVLTHPPMTQPDGKITTNYSRSYKVGNCPEGLPFGPDMFSWFIEHEWESVKGQWQFKVLVNGKPAISKTFTTY
jgi:hypothetical protein